MEEVLIIQVCELTQDVYNFNEYVYRKVTCKAATDAPFDTLIPIEENVSEGDIIRVEKCKLVRVDYENEAIITAVRIDKFEKCKAGTEISKYFNIPFLGLIKRQPETKIIEYGPDKIKFLKVRLQMRDSNKKTFIVYLLAFDNKATLLDSFERFKIITGYATLKHRKSKPGYELALISAEEYRK